MALLPKNEAVVSTQSQGSSMVNPWEAERIILDQILNAPARHSSSKIKTEIRVVSLHDREVCLMAGLAKESFTL